MRKAFDKLLWRLVSGTDSYLSDQGMAGLFSLDGLNPDAQEVYARSQENSVMSGKE
jgi:hypothetical protein